MPRVELERGLIVEPTTLSNLTLTALLTGWLLKGRQLFSQIFLKHVSQPSLVVAD